MMEELEKYEKLVRKFEDINMRYPETKNWLKEKGISHISELDSEGLAELTRHVEKIHDTIVKDWLASNIATISQAKEM